MTTFYYGGCVWPIDPACKTAEWDALEDDVKDRSLALASATLQRLTGGRVGGCPIRVRPQPARGGCYVYTDGPFPGSTPPFSPHLGVRGEWRNCGRGETPCEVILPAPVTQLHEVWIDGVQRDYDDFRIDNAKALVYQGTDDCPFPAEQNLNLDRTEPGTFEVIYMNTYPVDMIGSYAVGILAMEYAKACSGSGKCRLPSNVVAIARQGVSYEIIPGSFPDGFTGIREVDTFIAMWNPRGLKQPPTIVAPGQRERLNTAAGMPAPSNDFIGGDV